MTSPRLGVITTKPAEIVRAEPDMFHGQGGQLIGRLELGRGHTIHVEDSVAAHALAHAFTRLAHALERAERERAAADA